MGAGGEQQGGAQGAGAEQRGGALADEGGHGKASSWPGAVERSVPVRRAALRGTAAAHPDGGAGGARKAVDRWRAGAVGCPDE
ncbi:hypothetical protein SNE510_10710 [Streptomyces sp. NE5-10]|nr:hypothetical protein SNE510_10710 [Streptomyces sp. NE5-10]